MISTWLSQFITFSDSNQFAYELLCGHIVFALIVILFSVVCGVLFNIGKKH